MFYLRTISKEDSVESNSCMGKVYIYINKEVNPTRFNESLKHMEWMNDKAQKECVGIISDENGQLKPLFPSNRYYIMTENGNTYAKIKF